MTLEDLLNECGIATRLLPFTQKEMDTLKFEIKLSDASENEHFIESLRLNYDSETDRGEIVLDISD